MVLQLGAEAVLYLICFGLSCQLPHSFNHFG
jgi:hypothetical protein